MQNEHWRAWMDITRTYCKRSEMLQQNHNIVIEAQETHLREAWVKKFWGRLCKIVLPATILNEQAQKQAQERTYVMLVLNWVLC